MIGMEFLFRARITLAPPLELGETPAGRRRIIEITGGIFSGPKLTAVVAALVLARSIGASIDRVRDASVELARGDLTVRADGVAVLDARYTLATDEGAYVHVRNRGYRHGPEDVIRRLNAGEPVDPALYYMRTTPWFETADARLAWLNRTVCVATGARRSSAVELDFYALT